MWLLFLADRCHGFDFRLNIDQATRENFYCCIGAKELHFSTSHFKEYAKAADAIIMHNIWKDTLQSYMIKEQWPFSFGTDRISHKENELCFILCLADTIEPLKRDPKYANDISFSFEPKLIEIDAEPMIIKNVYGKIRDCNKWLAVNVKKQKAHVRIEIKDGYRRRTQQ